MLNLTRTAAQILANIRDTGTPGEDAPYRHVRGMLRDGLFVADGDKYRLTDLGASSLHGYEYGT